MRTGLLALPAVVLAAAGITASAQLLPVPASVGVAGVPERTSLPISVQAATPVCPGPESLTVPPGDDPVPPPGPVVVAAVLDGQGNRRLAATLDGRAVGAVGDLEAGLRWLELAPTAAGPLALRLTNPGPPPPTSAVQLSLSTSGDLRGLSGLVCAAPSTQAWLVGGGTQPGRRVRLLLANPAATPAVVTVTVHGPRGAVEARGDQDVVVPADGEVGLRIDAMAPQLTAVAVHVQSRTGRVVAALQDSYLRGTTPVGVDDVSAAAAPALRQLVPGLSIAPVAGSALPADPAAPGAVAVRVVNPGTAAAVARIGLLGEHGTVPWPNGIVTVPPGAVLDTPVTGVPAGEYTAVVTADVPVIAGAVVGRTRPGGQLAGTPGAVGRPVPPSEFAWATSVPPLTGTTLLALPALHSGGRRAAVSPMLVLTAPEAGDQVEVTGIGPGGRELATRTVDLAPGSLGRLALPSSAWAVRIRPRNAATPVVGAVVLTLDDPDGAMLTVLPLRSGPTGAGPRPDLVSDVRVGLGG